MQADTPLVRINEAIRARWGSGWSWDSGVLPDYDIWLPIDGEGTIQGDGPVHTAVRGDCFFLRKGQAYVARQKEGKQLKILGIHLDFVASAGHVVEPESFPPFHRRLTDAAFAIQIAERCVDAWRRDDYLKRDMRALQVWGQALFEEMCSQDQRDQETPVWRGQRIGLERIRAELRAYPSMKLSVEQLAERMGCSRWQFCRIFKQHFGITPQEYMLTTRLSAAKHLLESSTLTAAEIGARLGYTDASYFSKQFLKQTGHTPAKYRKMVRS